MRQGAGSGYWAYVRSPRSAWERRAALARASYVCEDCGASDVPLRVHHMSDEEAPGADDADVRILCVTCHSRRHDGKPGDPCTPRWAAENLWVHRLLNEFAAEDPTATPPRLRAPA